MALMILPVHRKMLGSRDYMPMHLVDQYSTIHVSMKEVGDIYFLLWCMKQLETDFIRPHLRFLVSVYIENLTVDQVWSRDTFTWHDWDTLFIYSAVKSDNWTTPLHSQSNLQQAKIIKNFLLHMLTKTIHHKGYKDHALDNFLSIARN